MSIPKIAVSILSADFSKLFEAIQCIEHSACEWIHIDVMDGHFVPNLSFGPPVIASLRPKTSLVFDVHLMIEKPEHSVEAYIQAGANNISFHVEACVHAHRLIQRIRAGGCSAGVSIVPSTPVSQCRALLPFVDQVILMTVNPGFGGQAFIPEVMEKLRELNELKKSLGYNFHISVDGGVHAANAAELVQAGATVLVSGSAFFSTKDPSLYVQQLRQTSRYYSA